MLRQLKETGAPAGGLPTEHLQLPAYLLTRDTSLQLSAVFPNVEKLTLYGDPQVFPYDEQRTEFYSGLVALLEPAAPAPAEQPAAPPRLPSLKTLQFCDSRASQPSMSLLRAVRAGGRSLTALHLPEVCLRDPEAGPDSLCGLFVAVAAEQPQLRLLQLGICATAVLEALLPRMPGLQVHWAGPAALPCVAMRLT